MTIQYSIPKWDRPAPTQEKLDYADLVTIDLSRFDSEEGKKQLVEELRHAFTDVGFWVVTGTGFTEEEIEHQFAIGQAFYKLPLGERNSNKCDFANGGYFGYRGAWERTINGTDVKDNMELVNLPKYTADYAKTARHAIFKAHEDVIADFSRKCWYNVARKLFILFALALELPENYFVDRHEYDKPSQDHLRYMMYHPRSIEDDAKCNNLWSWGHTDYGSLTLLFSQTVSGLQVQMPDGHFRDVRPLAGSIVVNVADTLSFMTKGYLKSTVHRVHRPPVDQDHIQRIGVIYGCRPNDQVPVAVAPSPVLERLGLYTDADRLQSDDAVTAAEYVASRVKFVHNKTEYGSKPGSKFKYKDLEIVENHEDPLARNGDSI